MTSVFWVILSLVLLSFIFCLGIYVGIISYRNLKKKELEEDFQNHKKRLEALKQEYILNHEKIVADYQKYLDEEYQKYILMVSGEFPPLREEMN